MQIWRFQAVPDVRIYQGSTPLQIIRRVVMLPIGQQLWLKELESYQKFPPLQAPASYNLSQIEAEVKKAHANHPSD
jgi:hypothetical protein